MLSGSLPWLRAHWRPVAGFVGAAICFACGWIAHRPAPRIEYRERVVYRERTAAHATEQARTETHADTDAVASASLAAHHRVHRRRVIVTAPDGSSTDTRETTVDDGLTLETAQEVTVTLQTASLVLGALDVSREASTSRTVEMVQTPAAPPSWRVGGLAGLSGDGPVYGGEVSRRVLGPVWVGVWATTAPEGGVSVGWEW